MVNNKGFARVLELLISITLISIILILSYKQVTPRDESQDLSEIARDTLLELSSIESFRSIIISNQPTATYSLTRTNNPTAALASVRDFVSSKVPSYIKYELVVCEVSSACGRSLYFGDVYSAERIISADKDTFNPVKLRLFLWVEQ